MYPSIVRGFLVCPTNTALRGPALSHTEPTLTELEMQAGEPMEAR